MSIVVVGSVTWDVAAFAGRLPGPGETLLGDRYTTGLGGKGANQAVAAARLGGAARFFGRVGQDAFGDAAVAAMPAFGLDPADLARDADAATALGVILVGGGENAIVQAPGANRACGADDVARAGPAIRSATVVLVQLEAPLETALLAARAARRAGAVAILDPAPAPQDGLPGSVFMAFDIVTPNEVEAESFAGFRPTDAESGVAAAKRLVELGAPTAIVTLGAAGCAWAREAGDASGFVPPFRVATVDSVAAGDCFNGALAVALTEGRPFEQAVRFAAAAGALATARPGAADAAPTRTEVEALLGR